MLLFRSQFSSLNPRIQHKPLYAVCLMLFFWTLFDGTVAYTAPLAISQAGLSHTMLGLIIGSSSIFGGIFDILLSRFLSNMHFRRVYLLMFAACFTYPLILWQAKTIWLFLVAMAIWGFYYDLVNVGTFDFVSRKSEESDHTKHFGRIAIFRSLGYLLAPLIVGAVLGELAIVDWKPIALMLLFLGISASFYILLSALNKKENREYLKSIPYRRLNFLSEVTLWRKIGKLLLPILLLSMLFNIVDSFFWTLGPILAESLDLHPFNGLFLTAYTLPTVLTGWWVGRVTQKVGKKKTAFLSFFIGAFTLSFFAIFQTPIFMLGNVLLASFFIGLALPAINGAYADYLAESPHLEREVASIQDFFTNLGYAVGPIMAGFLADKFGNASTFSLLGIICSILVFILFLMTPKRINLRIALPKL